MKHFLLSFFLLSANSAYAGFSFESRCADTNGNLYSIAYYECFRAKNCQPPVETLTCLREKCSLKTGTKLEGQFIDRVGSFQDNSFGLGRAYGTVERLMRTDDKEGPRLLYAFNSLVVLCSDRQNSDYWNMPNQ